MRNAVPLLLDLFCGQGGATAGYLRAGFRVHGVDNQDQPRYPGHFFRADALDVLRIPQPGVAAWHASPPCLDHTSLAHLPTTPDHGTAHLLAETIDLLRAQPLPWVVENVVSRSTREAMPGAVLACGRALGIPMLKRHRLFLASFPLTFPACTCKPGMPTLGVYGHLRPNPRANGDGRGTKATIGQARAMFETPWMDAKGLAQAIPAKYTEHVGRQLLDHLSTLEATA